VAASVALTLACAGGGCGDDGEQRGPPASESILGCLQDAGLEARGGSSFGIGRGTIGPGETTATEELSINGESLTVPREDGPALTIRVFESADDVSEAIRRDVLRGPVERVGDYAVVGSRSRRAINQFPGLGDVEDCIRNADPRPTEPGRPTSTGESSLESPPRETASRARACLGDAGFRTNLAPVPPEEDEVPAFEVGFQRGKDPRAGGLLAVYEGEAEARRQLPAVEDNTVDFGGAIDLRGPIMVVWFKPPEAATERDVLRCIS
jgi:hypothetical protein